MKRKKNPETGHTPGRTKSADALVTFGVTGNLAHKMIFPALYAMGKRDANNLGSFTSALATPSAGVAVRAFRLLDDQPHITHAETLIY